MTAAFDPRIVRVGLIIDGEETFFEGLDIRARGRKFLSSTMNQCEVQLSNLTREHRNWLLTNATPMIVKGRNRRPVKMTLDVGRESYGTFRLFEGDCFACDATQPPDISIRLRSLTANLFAGLIGGYAQSGPRSLRLICGQIAQTLNLNLDFQATDKTIDNYNWTGSAHFQLEKLNQMGGVIAAIDDRKLLVIDANKVKTGGTRIINMASGMVGIPQVNESGVTVRMLVDNSIELGGQVKIESQINPAASGDYRVGQINFDICNRADPFWYSLFCSNLIYLQGQN